jgi:hypothetical protein
MAKKAKRASKKAALKTAKKVPRKRAAVSKAPAHAPDKQQPAVRVLTQPADPEYARIIESMKEAAARGVQERERMTQARKALDQVQARRDRPRITVTPAPVVIQQPLLLQPPSPPRMTVTLQPSPPPLPPPPQPPPPEPPPPPRRRYGPPPQLSSEQIERGEALLFIEWDNARNLINKAAVKFVREQMGIKRAVVSDRRLIEDMIRPVRKKYRVKHG